MESKNQGALFLFPPTKKLPKNSGVFLTILSPKELDQSVEEVLDTFETEPGFPHP